MSSVYEVFGYSSDSAKLIPLFFYSWTPVTRIVREIEVTSSYRGFEQKDYKHLIKKWFMLIQVLL